MRILIPTLLLLASGLPVLLPAQVNRDSLRQIWENENLHDTLRLKAIHEWAWDMRFKYPDSLFSLTNMQIAFAREGGYPFWEARAINSAGVYYYIKGDFASAYSSFKKALDIFTGLQDWHMASTLSGNIGLVLRNQGNNLAALDFFQKALAIDQKYGFTANLSPDYLNLGILFQDQGDYAGAMTWCRKALESAREASGLLKERDACHCLYQAYKASGQTARALEFHEQYKLLTDSLQREEIDLRLSQMEFSRVIQAELRKKNRGVRIVLLIALGLLLVTLAFLARMTYFRRRSEKYQTMAQELEKQQLINEVALLKTQINPHFLFNSLSILSSLVHHDADLSEKFIQQLSKSYRYILEQRDQSLVSFRTELEFIEAYTFLLKIRFENKFNIQYELPGHALGQYKIAPLTLQLLIENAVKHNRMSVREPLIIRVDMQDGMLQVKNRIQARSTHSLSTGMGLENIRNSYALLSDRPVWAGEKEGEFIVKVPLIC